MKSVYCSNCGKRLMITKKVFKGNILDLVEYHECTPEPVEFDISPIDIVIPVKVPEGKDKFVQKLNDLSPKPKVAPPEVDQDSVLRDRRSEVDVKTSAPANVSDVLKSMM